MSPSVSGMRDPMRPQWRSNTAPTVAGIVGFTAIFAGLTGLLAVFASTGSILGVVTGIVLLGLLLMAATQVVVGAVLRRREFVVRRVRSLHRQLGRRGDGT